MNDIKDFPHPIGVEIEEEIPVTKNQFNPTTGKVTTVIELEKVKTTYLDIPKEKLRCQDGDHLFKVVDGAKGLFSCTNCPYHRQVYPTSYMFINGRLINKRTGRVV